MTNPQVQGCHVYTLCCVTLITNTVKRAVVLSVTWSGNYGLPFILENKKDVQHMQ